MSKASFLNSYLLFMREYRLCIQHLSMIIVVKLTDLLDELHCYIVYAVYVLLTGSDFLSICCDRSVLLEKKVIYFELFFIFVFLKSFVFITKKFALYLF